MLDNIRVIEKAHPITVGEKSATYVADILCPHCGTLVEKERIVVQFKEMYNEGRLSEESFFKHVQWYLRECGHDFGSCRRGYKCESKKPEPWRCDECGILFVLNRRGREQLLELWKTRAMLVRLE